MTHPIFRKLLSHIKQIAEAFDEGFRATKDHCFLEQKNKFLHEWGFNECESCGNIDDESFSDQDGNWVCLVCKSAKEDLDLERQIR